MRYGDILETSSGDKVMSGAGDTCCEKDGSCVRSDRSHTSIVPSTPPMKNTPGRLGDQQPHERRRVCVAECTIGPLCARSEAVEYKYYELRLVLRGRGAIGSRSRESAVGEEMRVILTLHAAASAHTFSLSFQMENFQPPTHSSMSLKNGERVIDTIGPSCSEW